MKSECLDNKSRVFLQKNSMVFTGKLKNYHKKLKDFVKNLIIRQL